MNTTSYRPVLSASDIEAIASAANAAANTQEGAEFSIAIVDASGYLLHFERQLNAPLFSITLAQDKAYTAATTARNTGVWADILEQESVVAHGLAALPRFAPLPGGQPLAIEGYVVGAVGISGGHWSQDDAVASAAVAASDGNRE